MLVCNLPDFCSYSVYRPTVNGQLAELLAISGRSHQHSLYHKLRGCMDDGRERCLRN